MADSRHIAIGTSHTKTGQPCQDSVRVRLVDTSAGQILISAVSDGAGSAPTPRLDPVPQ